MPKVPVYEQQVKTREAQAPAPTIATPVQGASGAEVATASAKFGEQISKTADVIQSRLLELRQRDDDQEVLDRATNFQQELQNTLYNQDKDQQGVPLGMLDRQLGQVKDLTVEYDGKVNAMQKKYIDSLRGENQKVALSRLLAGQSLSAREQIIRHESTQRDQSYDKSLNNVIENATAQAANTIDPSALGILMTTNGEALRRSMQHLKMPPEEINYAVKNFNGKMVKAAFDTVLEQDPRSAQRLLETHQDAILGTTRAELEKALEGKMIYDKKAKVYAGVSGYLDPQGMPDEAKMETEIRKMKEPQQRIEQFVEYMHQRSGERRQNIQRSRDTADRQFANRVLEAKGAGQSMDQVMKMVPSSAFDAKDLEAKQDYVRKLYSGPQISDSAQYMALWEGIRNKAVGRNEIDQALNRGDIKASDWEQLRKDFYHMSTEGETVEDKDIRERVTKWGNENILNKKNRDNFMYVWEQGSRAMPAPQKFLFAQELMKKHDPKLFGLLGKPEYKVQLQLLDADRTEMGTLYKSLGQDEVNAIGRGVVSQNNKAKWGLADVNKFANAFGGPDKIIPGTPAHNAIQSLNRHGKLVTVDTVRKALRNRPDGKF